MSGTTFLAYQRELDPIISEAEAQALPPSDSDDNRVWSQTYGGVEDDVGYSAIVAPDGGYIIAGETRSFGAGGSDVYLVKTDIAGYSGQPLTSTTTATSTTSTTIQIGPFTFSLWVIIIAIVIAVIIIARILRFI
jgi:hypothetical protein